MSSTRPEAFRLEASPIRALDAGRADATLPIVEGEGRAWAVVWPGVGAQFRSMHCISLRRGARTVELRHPMEAVYYIINGSAAVVDASTGLRQELMAGAMVHIDPGTPYFFLAGDSGVEMVGGPCPPDFAMYTHLKSQ